MDERKARERELAEFFAEPVLNGSRPRGLELPDEAWDSELAPVPAELPENRFDAEAWPSTSLKEEVAQLFPFVFARSPLFSTVQDNKRAMFKNKVLLESSDWKLTFTGEQLNQDDLDVWTAALILASEKPLGTRVIVSRSALLKKLNRTKSSAAIHFVEERLLRLSKASISVVGPLIGVFQPINGLCLETPPEEVMNGVKKNDLMVSFVIDPFWGQMLRRQAALVPLDLVRSIDRNKLARWLLRYIGSCGPSFSVSIETLRRLSGNAEDTGITDENGRQIDSRSAVTPENFKTYLKEACEKIMEKIPQEYVSSLSFKEDKLEIRRPSNIWKKVFVNGLPRSAEEMEKERRKLLSERRVVL